MLIEKNVLRYKKVAAKMIEDETTLWYLKGLANLRYLRSAQTLQIGELYQTELCVYYDTVEKLFKIAVIKSYKNKIISSYKSDWINKDDVIALKYSITN